MYRQVSGAVLHGGGACDEHLVVCRAGLNRVLAACDSATSAHQVGMTTYRMGSQRGAA